jgi:hypothetical protein
MLSGRELRSAVLGGVRVVAAATGTRVEAGGDRPWPSTVPTVERLVQEWQIQFGAVDFSQKPLFDRMVYLHPKPESAFEPFENEVLAPAIRLNHDGWMRRFFKGELLARLENLNPAGYYMNEGRTEPSLLLFKVRLDGYAVSIQENFNVVLLSLTPEDAPSPGNHRSAVVQQLLSEWTNVGPAREAGGITLFEDGRAFANGPIHPIHQIRDWRQDVVGFVADQGICFLFFKVDPEAPRAAMGLPYDFDWLNKGLFHEDGTTLVSPPTAGTAREQRRTEATSKR